MLVAAVLRPEEREDRELEVVRLAPHQRDDAGELPVREAELSMERLFRDRSSGGQSSPGLGGHSGLWRGGATPAVAS